MQVSGKHHMRSPIKTKPTGLEALQLMLDSTDPCPSQVSVSRLCKTLRALHTNFKVNTRAIARLNTRAHSKDRVRVLTHFTIE
jgi:hypothetical protein